MLSALSWNSDRIIHSPGTPVSGLLGAVGLPAARAGSRSSPLLPSLCRTLLARCLTLARLDRLAGLLRRALLGCGGGGGRARLLALRLRLAALAPQTGPGGGGTARLFARSLVLEHGREAEPEV